MDVSAPRVSPAASRRWVVRDRARKASTIWATSPTAAGSSAPAGAAATSCSSRRCR